jgi:hypothetical protein
MFDVRDRIYTPVWKFAWSRQDELYWCDTVQSLLKVHRDGIRSNSGAGALAAMERVDSTPLGFYDGLRFVLARMVLGALGTSMRRPWIAQATAEMAATAIALKRYALRYGALPHSLTQLVPEFFAREPIDYMDGKPLRYCRNSDSAFVLYSVGTDGRDDGGDIRSSQGSPNFQNARDLVWPQAPSEEEILAWRTLRK